MFNVRRMTVSSSYQLCKNHSQFSSVFFCLSHRLFSTNSNDGMKSTWKRLPSRGWSPSVNADTKSKNKPPSGPFVNFGKQFVIPTLESQENILAITNGYPLDNRVTCTLIDKKEQYSIDGNVTDMSVSEIVEEFFEKFDPDATIQKMMNGAKWPRDGYINPDGTPYTEAEIKKKWNNISDYAKNRDIWMHYNIARHFNQLPLLPSQDKHMDEQFLLFYEEVFKGNQMIPHRTSWPIVAPDEGIAGMVDFMGKFPDGTMALFLWRRSKTLADNLTSQFGRKGQFPIEHMDDCEGSKCYLHLNFLKYMLEKYYGIQVSNMIVVAFHTDLDSYYLQEVPLLSKEVNDVMAEIQRRQSEGFSTDNIPISSTSYTIHREENPTRSTTGKSSSNSSNDVDNENVLSSQSNQSPSPRRDHDIPF